MFTLGFKQVSQNTAENLFQTSGEMLNEVTNNDNDKTDQIISSSIQNKMTYSCPKDLKVNKMLSEMKTQSLLTQPDSNTEEEIKPNMN